MRRGRPPGLVLASNAALAFASLVFAGALGRALRPSRIAAPLSPRSSDTSRSAGVILGGAPDSAPAGLVLAQDPFDPDRAPAGDAEEPPQEGGGVTSPAPVVTIRLLGTIVRPRGSIAFCQLQAEAPRLVHVGEQCGDFTVLSIDQGRAAFRARDGARLELSLTPPGS